MNTEKPHFQAKKALEPTTSCTSRKRSPKLRHHKATGQAYVVLNGKYIFFGLYGSPDVDEQLSSAKTHLTIKVSDSMC